MVTAAPALARVGVFGCQGRFVSVGPVEVDQWDELPQTLRVLCPCGSLHSVNPMWREARDGEEPHVALPA